MVVCLLTVDQNVVQIKHNKDVELFIEDFIDVALKIGQSSGEPKRHDLIFEVAVPSIKTVFYLLSSRILIL